MRPHTRRLRPGQGFAAAVITDARRAALRTLAPDDPIGCEVALLRLTVQDLLEERPLNVRRILSLVDAVVRLLVLRHRLASLPGGARPLKATRALEHADRLIDRRAA